MFIVILAIAIPWLLGFFVARACLKKRDGYNWLALGMGYWIGLLAFQQLNYLERFTSWSLAHQLKEILLLFFLVGMLIMLIMPAKECFVGEQRKNVTMPIWQRMAIIFFLVLILIVFFNMIILRADFAETGVVECRFALKIFSDASNQKNYQNIISFIPYLSFGFLSYGFLRYLQCQVFIAFMGCVTLLFLPVFVLSIISCDRVVDAELWLSAWLLILGISISCWLGYGEYRQTALVIISIITLSIYYVSFSPYLLTLLLAAVLIFIIHYSMNWKRVFYGVVLIVLVLCLVTYSLFDWKQLISDLNAAPLTFENLFGDINAQIISRRYWLGELNDLIIQPNWHLLYFSLPICLGLWWVYPIFTKDAAYKTAKIFVLFTLTLLVIMLLSGYLGLLIEYRLSQVKILGVFSLPISIIPAITYEVCRVKPLLN